MKSLITVVVQFFKDRPSRLSAIALARFSGLVLLIIAVYSIVFHFIMEYEGRRESWITGLYWTLTVMSTLGFGDITFESDLGKVFSIIVMLSGLLFLLVLLPFTFIELFYAPWVKAQRAAATPRDLPDEMSGHVILTRYDIVAMALIEKFKHYHYKYVLLIADQSEAIRLNEDGYSIMLGHIDDPEVWRRANVENALAVVTTESDQLNANVAITVREVSEKTPVIATANFRVSIDILELAGCTTVLHVAGLMGQMLARQVPSGAVSAQRIGAFDNLEIAEAPARGTPLVGKTLRESRLRELTGVNVVGVWRRGVFETASADTRIGPNTVLVLAGSKEEFAQYNERYCAPAETRRPVVVIGGGRVGRAVGRELAARGLDYRIVEKDPVRIRDSDKYVLGDAAAHEVMEMVNIDETNTIIITTHDDDMNVYLTIYCRKLSPNAQIISRANLDRNVATLHRAGADFVMSYATMGATAVINQLGQDSILMVSEGLDIFEVAVPSRLAGKSIAETDIRDETGVTVVAVREPDRVVDTVEGTLQDDTAADAHAGGAPRENGAAGEVRVLPPPETILPAGGRMVLIGGAEAERAFLERYDE